MTMALEALKTVKLGSWGFSGRVNGANRVSSAEFFSFGRERVTIRGDRRKVEGATLLLVVACSDSGPATPQPKRKGKIRVDGPPSKTELKLLKELQEFIASSDLPPNQVPTTTELARNGRQDLANQVRRRGYKLVEKLLEQVCTAESGENVQSEDVTVPARDSVVTEVSRNDVVGLPSKSDETFSNDLKEPNDVGNSNGGIERLPPPDRSVTNKANVNGYALHKEKVVEEALMDQSVCVPKVIRDNTIKSDVSGRTLPERAKEFVEDFHQDSSGDLGVRSQQLDLLEEITGEGKGDGSVEEGYETDDEEDDDEYYEDDEEEEEEEEEEDTTQIAGRSDLTSRSPEDIAAQKAVLLRSKILQYFDSRNEDLKQPNTLQNADTTMKNVAMQQEKSQISLRDAEFQSKQKIETLKELDRMKTLLHSRELELSEVFRQLEEAKGMLALARAKATAELMHAKQLAVEQDARLHAAEGALSQLKQVHLEWWGEGSQVEVAGSFNGWQHHVPLEPDFSSEIPKADGARGPMMWGAHLCLYPGVYEIKFVVDGKWQVDHRREVVMRDSHQNNVIRVE